jgi:hypothetical protein
MELTQWKLLGVGVKPSSSGAVRHHQNRRPHPYIHHIVTSTTATTPSRSTVMAFVLPRTFAISATLKHVPKASRSAFRTFHTSPPKSSSFFTSKPIAPAALSKSQNVFRATFRRTYMQQAPPVADTGNVRQRLIYGAGIFGGTLLAINVVFNRETREDGGMPVYERSYLNDTFLHTGLGIGIIGVAARALHMNGWSYRLMAMNPWVVLGVGLVGSIGTMYGTRATSPDK